MKPTLGPYRVKVCYNRVQIGNRFASNKIQASDNYRPVLQHHSQDGECHGLEIFWIRVRNVYGIGKTKQKKIRSDRLLFPSFLLV
jgi:hypothetical protein